MAVQSFKSDLQNLKESISIVSVFLSIYFNVLRVKPIKIYTLFLNGFGLIR